MRTSTKVAAAAACAVVLVSGAVAAAVYVDDRATDQAIAEAAHLGGQFESARADLCDQIGAAQKLLTDTVKQVRDPKVSAELDDTITTAQASCDLAVDLPDNSADRKTAERQRDAVAKALDDVHAHDSTLHTAADAVTKQHSLWLLDQAKAAAQKADDDLAATIAAVDTAGAEDQLATTDGKVLDNAPRQVLRDSIDALNTAVATAQKLPALDATTVNGYDAAAKARADAKAAIEAATTAVAEAQSGVTQAKDAWDAEQARLAEQARVAAAAKSSSSSSSSSRSNTKSSSTSPKSSSSQGSSSSNSAKSSTGSGTGSTGSAPSGAVQPPSSWDTTDTGLRGLPCEMRPGTCEFEK